MCDDATDLESCCSRHHLLFRNVKSKTTASSLQASDAAFFPRLSWLKTTAASLWHDAVRFARGDVFRVFRFVHRMGGRRRQPSQKLLGPTTDREKAMAQDWKTYLNLFMDIDLYKNANGGKMGFDCNVDCQCRLGDVCRQKWQERSFCNGDCCHNCRQTTLRQLQAEAVEIGNWDNMLLGCSLAQLWHPHYQPLLRPIDNGMIALCCVMRKRVTSEELASFDVMLTQLVSTHLVKMSKSLLRSMFICCRLS